MAPKLAMHVAALAAASVLGWAEPPLRADPASTMLEAATRALRATRAAGFVHIRDVRSGAILAHVGITATGAADPALGVDARVAPLSVVKIFVATAWIEHGFGQELVDCDPSGGYPARRMNVDDVLITGCDSAGARIASLLRHRVGVTALRRDFQRYGLSDLVPPDDVSDARFGMTLSLGETVDITPRQVSWFLRMVGGGGDHVIDQETAVRVRQALEGVVQRGTATSIEDALAGTGWTIGGKTGTGPGQCGERCDGWFAGLLSDASGGRYVILAMIRGRGAGGGVAAQTVATIARSIVRTAAD